MILRVKFGLGKGAKQGDLSLRSSCAAGNFQPHSVGAADQCFGSSEVENRCHRGPTLCIASFLRKALSAFSPIVELKAGSEDGRAPVPGLKR